MAYRRLPNTDMARIRALKIAIEKCNTLEGSKIVGVDPLKLKASLRDFESIHIHYKTAFNKQVDENKKMQDLVKSARIYISHFIQVLNLCVIRNEINKDYKKLYGLEAEDFSVPDLSSNEALFQWGKKIIQGEQNRLINGGTPIYNPSIARVNVDYSLFKDAYVAQKMYQTNTQRQLDTLSGKHDDVDKLLRQVWNSVEAHYQGLAREQMLEQCKKFGIVYYKRKKKERSADN